MRIKDYSLLENYSPGTKDCIIVETDDGTHSLLSTKVVNPYSKVQLDNKFSEIQTSLENTEKYSVLPLGPAEVSNANDPQTIYRGQVAKEQTPYDTATILVSSTNTKGAQFGILPNGDLVIRTRTKLQNDNWGPWSYWTPIGTEDNINNGAITLDKLAPESVDADTLIDGAVTLPKLGSDVFESIDINTIVDDGSETDTVIGIAQCFGDFCMMEVSIHFKRSVTYNSFALPFVPSHNICKDFSWWTNTASTSATSYIVFISASDNKCYIRRQDNGNLTGNVSFSIVYRRSAGS